MTDEVIIAAPLEGSALKEFGEVREAYQPVRRKEHPHLIRVGLAMLGWVRSNRRRLVWMLLVGFVLSGMIGFWQAQGDDLGSSYLGCRLVAAGETGSLYSHDPEDFALVGPGDAWPRMAARGDYHSFLHPYVQTPLWAYLLEPVCTRTQFPAFKRIFLALIMVCFAAGVWLVARFWTPALLHPLAIALILLALWFSQPFQYAMFLLQTHALFFLMTIAALILAERDRPLLAGLLLACAAAVKVTPGVLLLYWLLTRRWKAAASLVVCSGLLLLGSIVVAGPALTAAYLADLQRVSRVLLVAQNNQSFAAWCMGRFYPFDAVYDVNIHPLPGAVRVGSMLLTVLCTAVGGWMDRRRPGPAPVGGLFALVGLTIFAPIAWTHYSVILVAPLMVLAAETLRSRSWWLGALTAVILVLNFHPLASEVITMDVGRFAIVRGQFFAGVLCLVGLAAVWWMRRESASVRHENIEFAAAA